MTVFPGLGFGLKHLTGSLNFKHHFDQGPLFVISQGGRDKDFNLATFDPMARFRYWLLINFIRRCCFGDGLAVMQQCSLVSFDLDNRLVAGFFSGLQRFFGNGKHRR